MIKIIPKKTKHALTFRLKIAKKKLLRRFKNEINPEGSIWNSPFYKFYWSKYTRAWLPCVDTVTCNQNKREVKRVEDTINNSNLHVSAQTSLVPSASFSFLSQFDFNSTNSASAWFPRDIWDYKHQNCASKTLNYGTQSHALFGPYGIIFDNYGIITAKFLETTYMVVKKIVKKKRFWLRLCCQTPVTSRPAETRMGKGKGAINHWATLVHPGQIWFEFEALDTAKLNQILICLQNRSPYPIKLIGITKP
jgi:large subunit ribosomal protein L16